MSYIDDVERKHTKDRGVYVTTHWQDACREACAEVDRLRERVKTLEAACESATITAERIAAILNNQSDQTGTSSLTVAKLCEIVPDLLTQLRAARKETA